MCGTCGCSEHVPDVGEFDLARAPVSVRGHDHDLERRPRRLAVEASLLAHNRAHAERLQARLARLGIDAIGLVGGPGAGKTALLEATFERLGRDAAAREAVVEGDCATDHDARRVAARGARAVQVATGALCHLDAHLVEHALDELDLSGVARLWIENVGNLVCPALFPCGERRRAVLVSVTEGDDKPEKYPALFACADLVVIAKADLLPHVDFDVARCVAAARGVRPDLPHLVLSTRTGLGMDGWLDWVREEGRP
jgi:hydrogenase nickel incorporation protein HypB